MRLRALLDSGVPGIRLLAGEEELDRGVRGVMTTDLYDPSRYLSGGELVLTGMLWRAAPEDSEHFVRVLVGAGVAGLAAGVTEVGPVPDDLIAACERHRLPLFTIGEELSFARLTEFVVRRISTERASDLTAVVDRHRRLVQAATGGTGLDGILGMVAADIDIRCWVLSLTGRQVAAGADPLTGELCTALARGHLAARARRARPPYRERIGGRVFSMLPIERDDGTAAAAQGVWSEWSLVVEEDVADWSEQRRGLLDELARLVAVEADRVEDGRRLGRRLAEDVLHLLDAGADPGEIAARLRVAEPDAPDAVTWQLVAAAVTVPGTDPDAAPGRRGATTIGRMARTLVEEALADLGTQVLVAATADGAVAMVPGPSEDVAAELRERLAGLEGAAGEGIRLSLGVSAPVTRADALRGALEESWHAARIADGRPGAFAVVGHEELASHVLLLAAAPESVRRGFRDRLLSPLTAYDARHQADLVTTLEAFLDCDGSWTRCAARLHVHVNTLRYRIGRIEELTQRDLSRLEDKVDFFLALRLR
ncbi:PucR family transcriptional regulator [Yinghuangia soli]|uniref:PucR family transcriptional regulator ligand-binding domain-containing protein n=1 Tax=Yinghuangia soli TaxID=2908204 RepID=A0AA41Q5S3_9ACTN|nr:PucR family transcriptional regulator [Yinghuangia soli]MCF2531821.1 PucR family transcriptional regulator ligand-binding domain-containing protein [Yinghuangia soli]